MLTKTVVTKTEICHKKTDGRSLRSNLSFLDFSGVIFAVLLLVLSAVFSRPCEQFPLNDEWAYGYPVQSLLSSGRLLFPSTTTFAITQILVALPFCSIFGFSYFLIRLVGLGTAILTCIVIFLFSRETGLSRKQAGLISLTFASNPFVICLANSFMTDVPSICCNFLMFLFLLKALKHEKKTNWILSVVFMVCSIACRQTALIFLPALCSMLIYRWAARKSYQVQGASFLSCSVITYLLVDHLVKSSSLFPAPATAYQSSLLLALLGCLHKPFLTLLNLWQGLAVCACYLSLFSLPIVVPYTINSFRKKDLRPSVRALARSLLIVGLPLTYMIYWNGMMMPFAPNLFSQPFLGAYCLVGQFPIEANPYWSKGFTLFTAISAVLLTSMLSTYVDVITGKIHVSVRSAMKESQSNGGRKSLSYDSQTAFAIFNLVSIFSIIGFLLLQTSVHNLDRYYLLLLPNTLCMISLLWVKCRDTFSTRGSFALCILLGIFGTMELVDYHNFSRTKERCIAVLQSKGIAPTSIDGGPEYNLSQNWNLLRAYKFDPKDPKHSGYQEVVRGTEKTRMLRWWPVTNEDFVISVQELPGSRIEFASEYWSPLLWKKITIFALAQENTTN